MASNPYNYYFSIQSIPKNLPPNAKVQDLIDPVTKSWNRELINQEFLVEEANIIYSSPLSQFGAADTLVGGLSKMAILLSSQPTI